MPSAGALRKPYYELLAEDQKLGARLGEEIAGTHLADYRGERFLDLVGLKPLERSWFEAAGLYALRYCRRAWRNFAYQKAVDRGVEVARDCLSQYFTEPSATDPSIRVAIPPAKLRALVGMLATEILNAHRNTLDGTGEVLPAEIELLHADEWQKEAR
jgi:hypothetical protein